MPRVKSYRRPHATCKEFTPARPTLTPHPRHRLDTWRERVAKLQRLLTDEAVTEFIVVGIPSRLAVAECARLIAELVDRDVAVRHVVINQILDSGASSAYLQRLAKQQSAALSELDNGNSPLSDLNLSRVPFYDTELRGVFPLKFLGKLIFRRGGQSSES